MKLYKKYLFRKFQVGFTRKNKFYNMLKSITISTLLTMIFSVTIEWE